VRAPPPAAPAPAHVAFVVPPLTGHINPTVAVGQALLARGHRVTWVGHAEALARSLPAPLPPGGAVWALGEHLSAERLGALHAGREARGLAAFQFLWEGVLLPLAEEGYAEVLAALAALKPDLCVVDQQALAGALACRALGLPWLTSCTTSAAIVDALGELTQLKGWLDAQRARLLAALPLAEATRAQVAAEEREMGSFELSPRGVLVFSSERLARAAHPEARFGEVYHFVGPALKVARAPIPFDWSLLRAGVSRVYFSLGTLNGERGARVYAALCEALGGEAGLQVIAAAPPALFPSPPPENFVVCARVPQLELLRHVDLVVTHAGHNTTCEALAHGLPLLALPIKDDQPVVAEQVRAVGAGLRLPFGRVTAPRLREAVWRLLREPSFREAARGVAAEFAREDGADGGARVVEGALRARGAGGGAGGLGALRK